MLDKDRADLHFRGDNIPAEKNEFDDNGRPPPSWRRLREIKSIVGAYRKTSTFVETAYYVSLLCRVATEDLHFCGDDGIQGG